MERVFSMIDRLRAALDGLGDALATANLDEVLAAESRLAAAVNELPRRIGDAGGPGGDLAVRIDGVRASLLRCRRLGVSLNEAARVSAHGGSYTRDGVAPAAASATMDIRG